MGGAWGVEVGDMHPVGHLQGRTAAGVGKGKGGRREEGRGR